MKPGINRQHVATSLQLGGVVLALVTGMAPWGTLGAQEESKIEKREKAKEEADAKPSEIAAEKALETTTSATEKKASKEETVLTAPNLESKVVIGQDQSTGARGSKKQKASLPKEVVTHGAAARTGIADLNVATATDTKPVTSVALTEIRKSADGTADKLTVRKETDLAIELQTEAMRRKLSASSGITQSLNVPSGDVFKRKDAVNALYSDQLKEIVAFEIQHGNNAAAKDRCAAAIKSFSGDQVARDASRILLLTLFEESGRISIPKASEQALTYIEKGTPDYEYANFDAALLAFQRDDADLAKELFEAFIKKYPESSWLGDAKTGLGLCAVAEGDMSLALGLFNNVWKTHPESSQAPKAMFMAGWVYMAKDHMDWAKETYARLIKTYPGTEYAKRAVIVLQQHGLKKGKDF